MMLKTMLPLAGALALLAGPAFAESARSATATLATPPVKAATLVVEDFRWRCEPGGCVGGVGPSRIDVVRACRELARKYGQVSAFTAAGADADAETLTACNADAKKS